MTFANLNQSLNHLINIRLVVFQRGHRIGICHQFPVFCMFALLLDGNNGGSHAGLTKRNVSIALVLVSASAAYHDCTKHHLIELGSNAIDDRDSSRIKY